MLLIPKSFIFLSLLYVVTSVELNSTKISSQRNAIRGKLCSYYSTTYTASQISSGKKLAASYNYMSDGQIQTMLYDKNYSSPSIMNILIVLPHLIAFVTLLVIWPCLCCCCVKPEKFPLIQKCRKPQKQMYTKCQLKWPSYVLILFCLIVLAGSVTALFGAADITNYYADIGCKLAAVFDDSINGRISPTDSSKFFVGIKNLRDQLDSFNTQLSTFYSSSSSSLGTSSNVRTKQSTVEGLLAAEYSSYTNTVYNNAFSSDGVTFTPITSNFKDTYYGPVSDSTKILGKINSQLSTIFSEVNSALDPMIASWNILSSKTQSGINTQIATASTNLATFVTEYNKYLNNEVDSNFDKSSTLNAINILMNMIFGLILALTMICLIGAILLAFCTVVRVRLLIYGTCGGLVFLGLLCFTMFVSIGYALPNLANVCNYINNKIQFGITTQIMFNKAGFSTFGNTLTNCMSDGDGSIIGKLDANFEQTFDNIKIISTQTQKFNDLIPNFTTANIASPFNAAKNVVENVRLALSLDVSDSIALTHISKVGSKGYSIDTGCNSTTVSQDAWYPNFINYSCPPGFKQYEPCSNLADYTSSTGCPKGCYQIMDQLYVSPSGDSSYSTNLITRYLIGASCNYITYIINLNDNWNIPRSNKMITVQNSLNNIQAKANQYDTQVKAVQSSLSAFKTNLQANFDSRTNMQAGSFYGVNCTVIGQSIEDFRNALCVGLLNNLNYSMICLGLICYGILFLSCCATCAGVRHFKHLQSMQVHVGYKGMPITVSENRVFNGKQDDNKQRSMIF